MSAGITFLPDTNKVTKTLLNSHYMKFYPSKNITLSSEPHMITGENSKETAREYQWNVSVKTATVVPHNKPDLMTWNQEAKIDSIIEFSCPLDIKINKKVNKTLETYGPLVCNLQIMYPGHKAEVAPIVIGTMRYVPKCLINYLKMIGFNKNESK